MIALLILIIIALVIYHDFRLRTMETRLSSAKSSIHHIRESEERFVERCIEQEEVLRFYADENNYENRLEEDVENLVTLDSLIDLDRGDKAREILSNVIIVKE